MHARVAKAFHLGTRPKKRNVKALCKWQGLICHSNTGQTRLRAPAGGEGKDLYILTSLEAASLKPGNRDGTHAQHSVMSNECWPQHIPCRHINSATECQNCMHWYCLRILVLLALHRHRMIKVIDHPCAQPLPPAFSMILKHDA